LVLPSFFICTFFFVAGINPLLRPKRSSSISRNLKYVLIRATRDKRCCCRGLSGSCIPWASAAGDMVKEWMYKMIGEVGTIGIPVVAVLAYVIWRL